jgi:threonine dehydrogenase-like Zn-dependent dehydrogenase
MGQTLVQKYSKRLLSMIEADEIDPSFIITHRLSLEEAPWGYEVFNNKEEECIKVVLKC